MTHDNGANVNPPETPRYVKYEAGQEEVLQIANGIWRGAVTQWEVQELVAAAMNAAFRVGYEASSASVEVECLSCGRTVATNESSAVLDEESGESDYLCSECAP